MASLQDIERGAAAFKWARVLAEAKVKRHPTPAELALLIKSYGIPDDARDYVAAWIQGDVHRGHGGQRADDALDRFDRALQRAKTIERLRAAFRLQRLRAPLRRARELVAWVREDGSGIVDVDTVARTIRRDLKVDPDAIIAAHPYLADWRGLFAEPARAIRGYREWEAVLAAQRDAGEVRLDPMLGVVWLDRTPEVSAP
jgi:hypothetical protein